MYHVGVFGVLQVFGGVLDMLIRVMLVPVVLLVLCALMFTAGTATAQSRFDEPVSTAEISYFARLLDLTEPEVEAFRALRLEYLGERREASFEARSSYLRDAMQVFEEIRASGEAPGEQMRARYPALSQRFAAINREQRRFDEAFLTGAIETVLGDVPPGSIERIQRARTRFLLRRGLDRQLPHGRYDLVLLLDMLELDTDVRAQVEMFIEHFEPLAIEALARSIESYDTYRRAHWESQDLMFFWQQRRDDEQLGEPTFEEATAYTRARMRVREAAGPPYLAALRQHASVNERAVPALLDILPPDQMALLYHRLLRLAYPEVHSDPSSAVMLHITAMTLPDLTDAQAEALQELYLTYEQRHAQLSEDLERAIEARAVVEITTIGTRYGGLEPTRAVVLERGELRERWNAQQIDLIRPLLSETQQAALPEWDFEAKPQRRPWDRQWERQFASHDNEIIGLEFALSTQPLTAEQRAQAMERLRELRSR